MKWYLLMLLYFTTYVSRTVDGHMEFTSDGCLAAHNKLRALHEGTNDVQYDTTLEKSAKEAAEFLFFGDNVIDSRPKRPLPKRRRKRRHDSDIDPDVHVESWSGDIYYPDNRIPKSNDYGESIHKFCCQSAPHCPKEFFHQLLFPPSAEGVVNDFYNEEIGSYDFIEGKKKSQHYTRIKHFASIVWKKTTKIGCAQTEITSNNCVYTVIHYKEEGATGGPESFKENIGALKAAESEDSNVLTIFLIVFFIVLLISLVVLCYCCRDNLQSKRTDLKIKIDTMKAEQELETDSTSLWWTRAFKKKQPATSKPSRAKSTKAHQSLKERPSIEVMPNVAPQRSIRMPPRVRGESNAQSFAIKYHGISKKARHYVPGEQIYENTTNALGYDNAATYDNHEFRQKPLPLSPTSDQPGHPNLGREPSLSGKPTPPPPVPTNASPHQRHNPMLPKQPVQQSPLWQKPVPVSRGPSNASNKPTAPSKPILPPAPVMTPPKVRPVPAVRRTTSNSSEASPSFNELRSQFNQQSSSPSTRKTPPVKPKPMLPPPTRPR